MRFNYFAKTLFVKKSNKNRFLTFFVQHIMCRKISPLSLSSFLSLSVVSLRYIYIFPEFVSLSLYSHLSPLSSLLKPSSVSPSFSTRELANKYTRYTLPTVWQVHVELYNCAHTNARSYTQNIPYQSHTDTHLVIHIRLCGSLSTRQEFIKAKTIQMSTYKITVPLWACPWLNQGIVPVLCLPITTSWLL